MADAVTDLALLNSGQMIPAEFWPDHYTKSMDEDRHRPWWELVPNPECDLTEEELDLQLSEWYGELARESEAEMELDYLMETLGLHGGIRSFYEDSEPLLVHFHRPPPLDVVVTNQWTSYVSPDEEDLPELFSQYDGKTPASRSASRGCFRKIVSYQDAQGRYLTRREIYRQLKRLGESRPRSHGWRGRTRQKHHPVHV